LFNFNVLHFLIHVPGELRGAQTDGRLGIAGLDRDPVVTKRARFADSYRSGGGRLERFGALVENLTLSLALRS
jgi:hypothetical protein